jgi:hypothetical protein
MGQPVPRRGAQIILSIPAARAEHVGLRSGQQGESRLGLGPRLAGQLRRASAQNGMPSSCPDAMTPHHLSAAWRLGSSLSFLFHVMKSFGATLADHRGRADRIVAAGGEPRPVVG